MNCTHIIGKTLIIAAFLGAFGVASFAEAQVCEPSDVNSELQYLRRLSLDLRGKLPAMEEYQEVIDTGVVPPTFVDDALASTDFQHQYGRFLRDLLHINMVDANVRNVVNTLGKDPASGVYFMGLRSPLYRGGGQQNVPCLDEPATFTDGVPDTTCSGELCQEGYVMVTPYWDPSTQVKVCAFDAQDAATGQYGDCDRNNYDPECGCGPNLDWCYRVDVELGTISKVDGYFYHRTDWVYRDALNEQITRIGTHILENDLPYTDLITTNKLEFNGPLVHLFVNKPRVPNFPQIDITTFMGPLADLSYVDEDTWAEAEIADSGGAAGVLTSPFFLLRYATNRARANRFYQSFLCKDFIAPPGGLVAPADPLALTPNLMVREGCDYCHGELEPAAAHWGRYNEVGAMRYDEMDFPDYREDCKDSSSASCAMYLTESSHPDEDPYVGYFRPLAFSISGEGNGNSAIATAVNGGPRAIAQKAIDDGSFAACTTQKVFGWMMGREPNSMDQNELDAITATLVDSGYDFKALVKTLVTSDAYRDHEYVLMSEAE